MAINYKMDIVIESFHFAKSILNLIYVLDANQDIIYKILAESVMLTNFRIAIIQGQLDAPDASLGII